jgi:hypothetical protein
LGEKGAEEKRDRPIKQNQKLSLKRTISMNAFSPLCTVLSRHVKEFFQELHGHQSKTLAMFVLGAIRAESIVLSQVAEALLAESEAKAPSIERRLERFLSNKKIKTVETWETFLAHVLPAFRHAPMRLIIDVTPYEEHAQVIYVGLLQQSRVLPLAWKVMPGQEKWEEGFWESIDALFERLAPHVGTTECTIIGDSAFGCFPMVKLCEKYGWHYVFRICVQHTCEHWSPQGALLPTCPVSDLLSEPGSRFHGPIRLWQEDQIETNLSAWWRPKEEEGLFVMRRSASRSPTYQRVSFALACRVDLSRSQKSRVGLGREPCSSLGSCGSHAAGALFRGLVAHPSGGFVHSSRTTKPL